MQYIKLRSSARIIQLQTGQLRRNNIQEQSKIVTYSDLELLVGTLKKLDLLGVFLLVDLTLFCGRSLRLLELQLQFIQLSLQISCPTPSPAHVQVSVKISGFI